MTSRSGVLAALLLAILATGARDRPASAQVRLGPEVQVNTWTTYQQEQPSVAADTAGEFVIAWSSYGQGTSGCTVYHGYLCSGVFARRFDAAGQPLGSEIQVHDSNAHAGGRPSVARSATGNFVVAWDNDIFYFQPGVIVGQRFDPQGQPLDANFVASGGSADNGNAAVAADADGGFVVVWTYRDIVQMEGGVLGRRYDADGFPQGDFTVSSYLWSGAPAVSKSETGDFVVAWDQSGGLLAQRYDASGLPLGSVIGVSASGGASGAALATVPGGGFVVVWTRQVAGDDDVFGRRYDAAGTALGDEFQINSFTTGSQSRPHVAADGSGEFMVVWASDGEDGSGLGVIARRYDASGQPRGGELPINEYTTSAQQAPVVAATTAGDFLVAWQSYGQDGSRDGVFARVVQSPLFADGFESGDACAWSTTVGGGCP